MEGRGWCYDLPPTACEGHVWEETATQISGKGSVDMHGGMGKVSPDVKKQMLGEGKENKMGRRIPAKQGKLDMNALFGKRPVLKDIINDAS